MPQCCAAFGCKSRRTRETKEQGVTFHKFPAGDLKKRWENAVRNKGRSASHHSVLCSLHFKPEHLDKTGQIVRIKEGAIPTIFNVPKATEKQRVKPKTKTKATQTRRTVQKAAAPLKCTPKKRRGRLKDDKPQVPDGGEHTYALPPSPETLKRKLEHAQAKVKELQRQFRNARGRERRCKAILHTALDELKKRSLNTEELERNLDALCGNMT